MKRFFLTAAVALASACTAQAQYRPVARAVAGVAQAKAVMHAQLGMRAGHLGGAINGTHEGTGYSTFSREDAIRRCCFYGTLPIREIGTARDSRGVWHAVIHYGR
jgi:hypothetical protein